MSLHHHPLKGAYIKLFSDSNLVIHKDLYHVVMNENKISSSVI